MVDGNVKFSGELEDKVSKSPTKTAKRQKIKVKRQVNQRIKLRDS